jgi:hypothetical protein
MDSDGIIARAAAAGDDVSAMLGLGHSFRSVDFADPTAQPITPEDLETRRAAAERFQEITKPIAEAELEAANDQRPRPAADASGVIPTNRGAYAGFDKRIRVLQGEGYSQVDATRIAIEEAKTEAAAEPKPKAPDYLGDSINNLMAGPKIEGGGGSRSSRFKHKKEGTRLCECHHLENCWTLADEERSRSALVGARVSPGTKDVLDKGATKAGTIVETVVRKAMALGMTVNEMLIVLEQLEGVAAPAA